MLLTIKARANAKRASKPESAAEVFGSSLTGVTSGPSLRERRSRPATRMSTLSSTACPSSNVVTAASSAETHPTPAALPSLTHTNGVDAAQVGRDSSTSTFYGSETSDGIASSAAVSTGFGTVEGRVLLPTVVLKEENQQQPSHDHDQVAKGVGNPLEADTAVGRIATTVQNNLEEDGDLSLLRPEDGGLVRGVVSHVKALMAASGRRTRCRGCSIGTEGVFS